MQIRRGLVVVKTHKTAGSTLVDIILRLGVALNVSCVKPAHGHSGYGCPHVLPPAPSYMSRATIFAQHVTFRPELLSYINPRPPLVVTIMRDPVDQAISAYLYPAWRHIRAVVGGANWTDHLARLGRTLEFPRQNPTLRSVLCYYVNSQAHDMGYAHYGNVVDTINAYNLVMLMERFDESLTLLRILLAHEGWRVSPKLLSYTKQNTNHNKPSDDSVLVMRHAVAASPIIATDLQLYALARTHFDRRWRGASVPADKYDKCMYLCNVDYVNLMHKCS